MLQIKRRFAVACLLLALTGASLPLHAQSLSGAELLKALQGGGQVIVMRHASSPRTPPDKANAAPGNVTPERQLDAAGRAAATAMGKALQDLHIPVGKVLSSTAFRALETALYAKVPEPRAYSELSDNGASMQRVNPEMGTWLRELAQTRVEGGNTLIITHLPNIAAAFPQYAGDLADGEALVFRPDGKGGAVLLARVKIEEWGRLGK